MLVINRFRVPDSASGPEGPDSFRSDLLAVLGLLAARPGYVDGSVGRNVDEPALWVLQTRWENVGSYRRALSSYDVKLGAVPLLATAIDEPSAYEVVSEAGELNVSSPRGDGADHPSS